MCHVFSKVAVRDLSWAGTEPFCGSGLGARGVYLLHKPFHAACAISERFGFLHPSLVYLFAVIRWIPAACHCAKKVGANEKCELKVCGIAKVNVHPTGLIQMLSSCPNPPPAPLARHPSPPPLDPSLDQPSTPPMVMVLMDRAFGP